MNHPLPQKTKWTTEPCYIKSLLTDFDKTLSKRRKTSKSNEVSILVKQTL